MNATCAGAGCGEIFTVDQPQIALSTGRVIGTEILHWNVVIDDFGIGYSSLSYFPVLSRGHSTVRFSFPCL
ncbi:hypothetical protein [Nitrosospira sp. Nl5]|uniref:hypothetical protein n=1 Tax=Nitrosospira sp. Nl5 TaxID=200120 RepID=UPI00210AC396|nr:hypothetical protein [Nitrosospira sp. Nl5]